MSPVDHQELSSGEVILAVAYDLLTTRVPEEIVETCGNALLPFRQPTNRGFVSWHLHSFTFRPLKYILNTGTCAVRWRNAGAEQGIRKAQRLSYDAVTSSRLSMHRLCEAGPL